MAEELKAAGLPLSDAQAADITALGDEYGVEWDQLQAGYGEETLKLEKVMDELELKKKFVDAMHALLTPDQLAVIVNPATHDRASIDVNSPVLMLATVAHPWGEPTKEALRDDVVKEVTVAYKLGDADVERVRPLADRWLASVALGDPVPKGEVPFYTLDAAIADGRAVIRFEKEFAATIDLSDDQRKALRDSATFGVPRLVKPAEKAGK
jgi:hypothetical protein